MVNPSNLNPQNLSSNVSPSLQGIQEPPASIQAQAIEPIAPQGTPIAKGDSVRQSEADQIGFNWHGTVISVDKTKKEALVSWKEVESSQETPLSYTLDNLIKRF